MRRIMQCITQEANIMLRYARPVMHTMHNTLCDAYSSVHNAALMAAPRIMRVHNAMHNAHQIAREIEMAREITVTRERCTRVRVALRGRARARARAHHDTVPLTRQVVVVRVFSSSCARTRHSKRRQPSHQPPRARCRTRTYARSRSMCSAAFNSAERCSGIAFA